MASFGQKCEIYEKENESQFCGFCASNENIGEMAFLLKLPLESSLTMKNINMSRLIADWSKG